jgi:hypothetical protein
MLSLTVKSFIKNIKNHAVYLFFLTFIIASITLFSNLIAMQSSFLQVTGSELLPDQIIPMRYDILSLLIIVTVVMIGFFAFQLYLNNQAKLLSIFRLGGTSFYKILSFFLIQLVVIFSLATFLGFNLGNLFFVFVNTYVCELLEIPVMEIQITNESLIYVICFIGIKLFYLLLLTAGFVIRHEIKDLLRQQESFDPNNAKTIKKIPPKLQIFLTIIFVLIYLYVLIRSQGTYGSVFTGNLLIVSAAYPLLLKDGISNVLKKLKSLSVDTNKYIGFAHLDFTVRKILAYLGAFAILLVIVATLMINSYSVFENFVYNICVYLILSIIFFLSIGYQLVLNLDNRQKDLAQLLRFGKTKSDLQKIISIEITGFFIIVFLVTFLLPLCSFTSAVIYSDVTLNIILLLFLFTAILFILAYVIVKKIYNQILKKI